MRRQDFAHADPKLAYEDPLTGLHNRRLLDHLLDQRWPDLLGVHDELALVVLDLDRFKGINDRYGHLIGDQVLTVAARVLRESFREEDFLIRYGGDEFVVIAPGSDAATVHTRAHQAREALEAHPFLAEDSAEAVGFSVSCSLGVASYPQDGREGTDLLRAADQRLYDEKRQRHPAAPSQPKRRAVGIGLVAAAVAALLLIFFGNGSRRVDSEVDGEMVLPTGVVTAMPSLAAAGPDRKALQAEIRELEAEVRILAEERADRQQVEQDDRQQQRQYEERIRSLEAQIEHLEAQLREQASTTIVERMAEEAPEDGSSVPEPDRGTADSTDVLPADPATATTPLSNISDQPIPPAATLPDDTGTGVGDAAEKISVQPSAPIIVLPRLVRFSEPHYPDAALRHGLEATIELRVVIDARGKVLSAEAIGQGVRTDFALEARRGALRSSFEPGTRDGVPVEMETTLTVRFQLDR